MIDLPIMFNTIERSRSGEKFSEGFAYITKRESTRTGIHKWLWGIIMPDKPPVHQYVPLPTQFLQEEEPSDIEDEDEFDAEYNQPLAQFRNPGTTRDHSASSMPSGRVLPANTFYGTSQRHLNTGQSFVHHGLADETISGRMQRGYRSLPTSGECSEDPYDYREVYNDPHQLIPSYHEYSITDVAGQSHSAESSGSFGIPDYFVPGTVSAVPSNSVGYGYGGLSRSNTFSADQRDMAVYETQQKQEPKVISNESNRYTIVGHTVEGQPIYALQSVRTANRPRLQQGSLYRVIDKGSQSRYVFLRQQQAIPTRRTRSESGDGKLSNENYRAVAREIVAKALEDKRIKQLSLQGSSTALPSSSGISGGVAAGKAKKKCVISDDEKNEKLSGSTVVAQAGAIQRFSTPLGWKQMGSWLKAAEASADWNRLKLLLSQCAQANLTLELLQSNDTPKFVRKLSKTCPDQDVRKVSVDLVMRWKRLVAAPPRPPPEEVKKVGSAKRKTPHPPSASSSKAKVKKENGEVPGANEKGVNLEASKQREAVDDKSEFIKKHVSGESVEDSDTVFAKVEKSTKTAKVDGCKAEKTDKTIESKSDSSKVERADKAGEPKSDSSKAEKVGRTDEPKCDSSKTESADKTTELKSDSSKVQKAEKSSESNKPALSNKLNEFNMFEKLGEERKDKKQRPKTAKTYTSKFRSTGLEGDDEVATAKSNADTTTALRKKASLPSKAILDAKKRTAMSASVSKIVTVNAPNSVLSVPSSSKKHAPSAPARVMMSNTFMDALMDPGHKKVLAKQPKKRPVTNAKQSMSVIPSVMEGLYSDTIKLLSKEKQEEASTEQKKGSVVDEPDIASISNRKIRFADEHGQELVEIRYFEVEEGERLNVSKLSSEDMKHLEMQRERTFMKEQRNLHITEFGFGSSRQEGSTHIPWKLIPLANAVCFEGRGSQSEAKKIEEERQKTIMMPFYDPSLPAEVADAEPELLTGAILPPTDIPLESEIEEDVNQDVTHGYKKAVAPWVDETLVEQNQGDGREIDVQKLMSELKKKGLVGSSSDLASILNKVSSSTATSTSALSVSSAEQVNATTSDATYVALTPQSSISTIPLPSQRFAHGLPMPPVLSTGQYIFPMQQQQPLLNGPVPAGVTPTVGVDLTTHSGPSTSEAPSYGTYGRLPIKQCTFYQAGTCSYGARCRFAHGEEPTAGTQGYGCSDERGRNLRRSGSTFRGGPRRGGMDVGYSFKRGRGGPPFGRRGYYDRERERDRDRDRDYDYNRRGCDRYERRRRRSWSRSRSRSHSRSRSRSESPFDRRQYSPDHRRRRASPHGMHEYDREERLERRLKGEDRERDEQHVGDGGNQVFDVNQQYQPQSAEDSCAAEGTNSSKVGSDLNTGQQKSPSVDPVLSTKLVDVVDAVNTNSPASPNGD